MKRIILSATASVALACTCQAQPANARGIAREVAVELLSLRADLSLTDGQRTQIRDIIKSHKGEIANQLENARDARQSMREAVEEGGPDSVEAEAAAEGIAEAARSRALLSAAILSEIRPILTPEQWKLAQGARERIANRIDERIASLGE